jgi:hypothetical protein
MWLAELSDLGDNTARRLRQKIATAALIIAIFLSPS